MIAGAAVIANKQNKRAGRLYNERQRKGATIRPLVERLLGGSVRTAERRNRNRKGSKKDKEIMVLYFF